MSTSSRAQSNSAGRPVLSPHLQVWRFTVTMAASITHRACGIALYGGTLVLAVWLYSVAFSPALFSVISGILGSVFGLVFFFGYAFALFFHMANGIRHLFWDAGKGFELNTARTTAWLAYGGAILLALVVTVAGFTIAGNV